MFLRIFIYFKITFSYHNIFFLFHNFFIKLHYALSFWLHSLIRYSIKRILFNFTWIRSSLEDIKLFWKSFMSLISVQKRSKEYFFSILSNNSYWIIKDKSIDLFFNKLNVCKRNDKLSFLSKKSWIVKIWMEIYFLISYINSSLQNNLSIQSTCISLNDFLSFFKIFKFFS